MHTYVRQIKYLMNFKKINIKHYNVIVQKQKTSQNLSSAIFYEIIARKKN